MKISFFIFHLSSGGAERVLSTLANFFAKRNHCVNIYTLSREPSFYELDESIGHVKLGKLNNKGVINKLRNLKRLYDELKRSRPDVLISFIDENNLMAVIVAKLLQIPVIISERSNPEKQHYNPFFIFLLKWLYPKASLMVLQTQASEAGFLNMGIKLPASRVIENPLGADFFLPVLKAKENVILSVGRLSHEKGHDILLKAALGLELGDWKVVIVGDGTCKGEYGKYIEAHNLSEKVTLAGKKANVIDYYNMAKIFVLPSRFEGFPNALIEAMSRGCVVISSDCAYGPAEIISNGVNGLLFSTEDFENLRSLLADCIRKNNQLDTFSEEAVRSVQRYRLEKVCDKWSMSINDVISEYKYR